MPDKKGYTNLEYQMEGQVPPQFRNGAVRTMQEPDKDGIIKTELETVNED